jgi:hypothetical protein
MGAQTDLPSTFHTDDPAMLKRELERVTSSLEAYLGGITGHPHAAVVQRRFTKRPLNDTKAAFWQITPVALVNSTDVHRISLPRPDPRNAGLVVAILRKSAAGTINLSAPDATVNGFAMVELSAAVGMYIGWFDGEDYYFPPGNVWGVP